MRSLGQIAEQLGGTLEGSPDITIEGIAGIRDAEPGDITFVANPKYASAAATSRASAMIVGMDWEAEVSAALIRVEHPDQAFAQVAASFAPPPRSLPAGIHSSAVVDESADVHPTAHIGPFALVEKDACIGAHSIVEAGCVVGEASHVGEHVHLYSGVKMRERTRVGDRVIIHNNTVIGSDGFGYTVDDEGVRTKIPQMGTVVIGADTELGANVTVDRARFGKTTIGRGVKIDNLVHIAHNVMIGDHTVIVAMVGISGSSTVGEKTVLAGQVGITGHVHIGSNVTMAARSVATKDIPDNSFVAGFPAVPHKRWTKLVAHYARLPEMKKTLSDLSKRLKAIEEKLSS